MLPHPGTLRNFQIFYVANINDDAERAIKDIRRQTRRRYSAEEKIRIVLSGLRSEERIAELCRQKGIDQINGIRELRTEVYSTWLGLWRDRRRASLETIGARPAHVKSDLLAESNNHWRALCAV